MIVAFFFSKRSIGNAIRSNEEYWEEKSENVTGNFVYFALRRDNEVLREVDQEERNCVSSLYKPSISFILSK